MIIRISRAAFDGIVAQASAEPDRECCGLLLAGATAPPDHIESFLPATNIALDPARRFEIDPAVLIRAHRTERAGGPRIIGCYHSHPGGNPVPSAEDAAQAEPNGSLWLICAGPPWTLSLWKALASGTVQGRFDPVEMIGDSGDSPTP